MPIPNQPINNVNNNYQASTINNKHQSNKKSVEIIEGSSNKALEGNNEYVQSIKDLMSSVDKTMTKENINESTINSKEFKAEIYLLTRDEGGRYSPITNNHTIELSTANESIEASIVTEEYIMPGNYEELTIKLKEIKGIKKGQHFQLKEEGKVIGIGVITEILK